MTKKYICPTCGNVQSEKKEEQKSSILTCKKCKSSFKRANNRFTSIKKLKEKAWSSFSNYVRARDCLETTKTFEEGICFTCGERFNYKDLQAGHMVSGRNRSTLFDENFVKIQCLKCNVYRNGEQGLFVLNMIDYLCEKGFSEKEAITMVRTAFENNRKEPFTNKELIDIREEYVKKLAILKIENKQGSE